ncbi:MAG: hypothetical protein KDI82_04090 [Gammaproteobacteria bacterium]|nr:hypothetical protein [Gammaproteobacteria bacterium]
MKPAWPILLLGIGISLLVYAGGLNGPFLFDDHVHITQNRWVKIDTLGLNDLVRAWNSSFSEFPADRPLAQLSFGVNHALSGLDPWAFKLTNLVIHLLNGILVFLLVRLGMRAAGHHTTAATVAAVAAAVWLLHPIHVSSVLYTVQRMTLLSATGLLLGLVCYLKGRSNIAEGRNGRIWMLAAAPFAMLGFLAKENAALMPLLLLSLELTLLQRQSVSGDRRFVSLVRFAYIALPITLAVIYLLLHPAMLSYDGRPFTLEERLLTQPRVLWTYIGWLLMPDLSAFGLFHDDLNISTGWLSPPTTVIAAVCWGIALVSALLLRQRYPVAAFALLFFIANHALESTAFPLEMMFEHRNYLAAIGPLALLAHLVITVSREHRWHRAVLMVGLLLAGSYSMATWLRVGNWSSYQNFVLSTVEHHPDSLRSNFMAAQMLIVAMDKLETDASDLAAAAEQFLERGLEIDGHCIDCLFGKVALRLHLGQQPSRDVLQRLQHTLANGDVGPTRVSISQFSFLVRWQRRNDVTPLEHADLVAVFDAALSNPGWSHTALAGISASYREYHEFVTGDLAEAEVHARAAVKAWPQQWGYHVHLVRVLRKRQQYAAARQALEAAETSVRNADQRNEFERLRTTIEHDLEQDANAD